MVKFFIYCCWCVCVCVFFCSLFKHFILMVVIFIFFSYIQQYFSLFFYGFVCLFLETFQFLFIHYYFRAKFSATASLGVVHASHATEAMQILQPYLPPKPNTGDDDNINDGVGVAPASTVPSTGGYAEGGSLYALGLIHGSNSGSSATQRTETINFLQSHLRNSHTNEVISHGACLGLGLAAMGTNDLSIINEIKEVLDTDSAVAGEAAGMAIGMVLVGSGAGNTTINNNTILDTATKDELMEIIAELKNYARETQHEKIIRGIAMGLALINYGQEDNADSVIEEMRSDRDPIMRYGAQYAIALAYCGTGSNKAVRILLHTAVSDVSNDVRMAAVISLAFVLYKTPDRVPQLVKLLLESFNPHVRYAACMAVGIAMAGTGDTDSIAMLEPMLDDMTDYVRQGALIGTAMIYMQQSDTCNRRKIKSFRERLMSIVTEKHQSTLTKMGSILAIGIIDAGGRNCSLSLGSRNGFFTKMTSAVGLVLWIQHWHWYPMMHMLSLALTPTASIGLNKDFKYPKNFKLVCHAKPSMFAYPKKLEGKKEEKKKRVETVTLSITVKEKARLARKKAKQDGSSGTTAVTASGTDAMDVDKPDDEGVTGGVADEIAAATDGDAMDVEEGGTTAATTGEDGGADTVTSTPIVKKKKEPEPTSFEISNPARVTKIQSKYCVFDMMQRYHPIRVDETPQSGVIMLTDTKPPQTLEEEDDDEDNLGSLRVPSLEPEGELPPPEPFVWSPPPLPSAATLSTVPSPDDNKTNTEDNKEDDEDEEENASSSDDKISTAESSD
jgi:26S proteasome regulatory subunit N2